MKLKKLEALLQQVKTFDKPKIKFEQYPTSSELTSQIIFSIANNDSFKDKFLIDLGVGTGKLIIGALVYEPYFALGIDIDLDALNICKDNIENLFIEQNDARVKKPNFELIQADILDKNILKKFYNLADIVIMNPPFGTKNNEGIDIKFLKQAINMSKNLVYSLHKTSTRNFIIKTINKWGYAVKVVANLNFDIPSIYKFHKKNVKNINVDLIRILK